jgi:hypothetical protein
VFVHGDASDADVLLLLLLLLLGIKNASIQLAENTTTSSFCILHFLVLFFMSVKWGIPPLLTCYA